MREPLSNFAETEPRCLLDCRNSLGEGPVWDDRRGFLWWIDIKAGVIHWIDPDSLQTGEHRMGEDVGSIGLCNSGRLIVALRQSVILFDPKAGDRDILVRFSDLRRDERLNDGKVGPDGAFWVGGMHETEIDKMQPVSALYRVAPDGSVRKVVDGLKVSNGLAWTPDGRTMYHSDSCAPWLDRWDFDTATGEIGNRTRIAEPSNEVGRPDGAAADSDGRYWSAGVSASRLNIWSRDGELLGSIDLPDLPKPTMPCFGGADMKTIFITGHRNQMTPEVLASFPHAGSLFSMRAKISGAKIARFADIPS
ncbi:SMP-30/gluconolactonase/LRE family protein [Notoacmeibacter sp. MSK16QG-6]|uniref:SMP-30/gluconolactonase/LRE family protein n=1 Tax=Notoacmeibacter sp. MSK16QG-6 TaxID=2957982 RepID=UPI00209EDB5A|nr:SMP-30/gluconolactonase/LRE family protein [Notoacmeibacter sp. MSK16QG-6]MCP1199578.1 SMP-30/gluconolactonase/LRE family protein [Notoacmeibacter sp. MSK16QG-6]